MLFWSDSFFCHFWGLPSNPVGVACRDGQHFPRLPCVIGPSSVVVGVDVQKLLDLCLLIQSAEGRAMEGSALAGPENGLACLLFAQLQRERAETFYQDSVEFLLSQSFG